MEWDYQISTNITLHLIHNILCSGHTILSWVWLDEQLISKYSKELMLTNLWYNPSKVRLNPASKFSCEIVTFLHKLLSFNGYSQPSCPLQYNPLFVASGETLYQGVKSGQQHNLNQVGLQNDNFQQFKTQFGLTD